MNIHAIVVTGNENEIDGFAAFRMGETTIRVIRELENGLTVFLPLGVIRLLTVTSTDALLRIPWRMRLLSLRRLAFAAHLGTSEILTELRVLLVRLT